MRCGMYPYLVEQVTGIGPSLSKPRGSSGWSIWNASASKSISSLRSSSAERTCHLSHHVIYESCLSCLLAAGNVEREDLRGEAFQ
jgi:hypothetical protein